MNERLVGVCRKCEQVHALAVWPLVVGGGADRSGPLIFRARRAGRRQVDHTRQAAAQHLARSGIEVSPRAETRWVTEGDPLGAEEWLDAQCRCGVGFRVVAKRLRRVAVQAKSAGRDRFTIPRV